MKEKNYEKFASVSSHVADAFFILFSRMCCIFDERRCCLARERERERVACIECIGAGIDRFDRHDIGMPVLHGYVNVCLCMYTYISKMQNIIR